MADTRITDLASFVTLAATDILVVVDVSDTSMGSAGTDKQLTASQLFGALTGDVTYSGLAGTIATGAVTTAKLAAKSVTAAKIADGTANGLMGFDGSGVAGTITQGSGITISGLTISATAGGGGTVTTVSIATANGFAGSVATATTTPVITLATTVTGLIKGNGTALSAAAAGTDYLAPGGSGAALTGITATQVGLGNVTNDAQTKASIVPNTAPTAGQIHVGNAGGTAFAAVSLTGSGATLALASTGVLTVSAIANASLVNSSVTIAGTATALGASITLDTITGLSTTGLVKRTGANALAVATAGTDYQAPITLTTTGTSGAATLVSNTLNIPQYTGGGGGSPGGSTGQLQYNNAGAFGGAANITVGASGQLNLASQAAPGSPANGDQWHDSTQHALAYQQGGMTTFRPGLIYAQVASVTVATSGITSLVSTTGAVGSVGLPAGFLNVAGRSLRLRAGGYLSTAGASQGNFYACFKLGSTGVITGSLTGLPTSQTNAPWSCDVNLTVKTTGATGTVDGYGGLMLMEANDVTASYGMTNASAVGTKAPGTPVILDLTAALTLDFVSNFSATGNSITLTNLTVEVLG